MTEEETQALNALIPLILEYRDDIQILTTLSDEAEKAFGSNWREIIPPLFNDLKNNNVETLKTNFRRALDYENSVLAWNEANTFLSGDVNLEHLKARIPAIEHWLAIFGDAGKDVVDRLKAMLAEGEANEVAPSEYTDISDANVVIEGFSKEVSFNFQYFLRLEHYYDQTISRVGARCVQLGGIEMSQYPQYGYVLDVLDELITLGTTLLTDPAYAPLVEGRFPGSRPELEKKVANYKRELEANAPPEMVDDAMSAAKLKAELGAIDDSEDNMPIGPAPDGFEPIPDLGDYTPKADIGAIPTPAPAYPADTATSAAPAAPAASAAPVEPVKESSVSAASNVLENADATVNKAVAPAPASA